MSTHPPRRFTNNHGRTQIKRGKTEQQMRYLAAKLGISYGLPAPVARLDELDGSREQAEVLLSAASVEQADAGEAENG
ncbi:hypothetical protein [Hydrocarboniphaga effusa]|uniref:hypothetical protein n=1 Tax=Hydrocarboniphaga effusa TaxID=243629 RepID=UPI00398BDD69